MPFGSSRGATTDLVDSALAAAGGLPTPDDLLAYYASRTHRDLTHAEWYRVLACFKFAILPEGTYARSLARRAPGDLGSWMHTRAQRFLHRPNC